MTDDRNAAPAGGRQLTGKHVLMICLAFFGVIIAVNFYMMSQAIGGFPGLVEEHPYRASQEFDKTRQAQIALGWRVEVSSADNTLHAAFFDAEGQPLRGLDVQAVVGRPATLVEDQTVALPPAFGKPGVYELDHPLETGMWRVELTARDGAGAVHRAVTEFEIQ